MEQLNLLFENLLKKKSSKEIADDLFIAEGTVRRWIKNKKIPKQYKIDIMTLNDSEIDLSKFSYQEKDQFFTDKNTAKYCYNVFLEKMKNIGININEYIFIEPSAGDGSFIDILPENSIYLDIEPRHKKIIKNNFLYWKPKDENKKYIGFGNPPFGLRGNLAIRFINHFSCIGADFVCFILPQLFESDGKGSPRKRIKNYNLIHSELLKDKSFFYYPDNKDNLIKINCIFQIWSKNFKDNNYIIKNYNIKYIDIYSLSNGKLSSQKRNVKFLDNCDIYIPSTCFGIENIKCYKSFNELPNNRGFGIKINDKYENKIELIKLIFDYDWSKESFLSTNSAYNLRTSIILNIISKLKKNLD